VAFNEELKKLIGKKRSYVCVGLDTDLARIPGSVSGSTYERMVSFNRAIVDATGEYAAAYKLNSAFYESQGAEGIEALRDTIGNMPADVCVILDAKRGDIGNTARHYAQSVFSVMGAGAVTVNPYMGIDSVEPFLADESKGCFILCATSNKGGDDFQKRILDDGRPLYMHVASTIVSWNTKGNAGMVIGATRPEELAAIRAIAPDVPFLIPGIGAQGGDLEQTVSAGIGAGRAPALINSSRGIIFSSDGPDFADSARRECRRLRDAVNAHLGTL